MNRIVMMLLTLVVLCLSSCGVPYSPEEANRRLNEIKLISAEGNVQIAYSKLNDFNSVYSKAPDSAAFMEKSREMKARLDSLSNYFDFEWIKVHQDNTCFLGLELGESKENTLKAIAQLKKEGKLGDYIENLQLRAVLCGHSAKTLISGYAVEVNFSSGDKIYKSWGLLKPEYYNNRLYKIHISLLKGTSELETWSQLREMIGKKYIWFNRVYGFNTNMDSNSLYYPLYYIRRNVVVGLEMVDRHGADLYVGDSTVPSSFHLNLDYYDVVLLSEYNRHKTEVEEQAKREKNEADRKSVISSDMF